MNGWLDKLLVAIVLAASAGYAVYSLGPRSWRRSLAMGLLGAAARAPRAFGLKRLLGRVANAAAAKVPGGCGGCEGCGDGEAAPGQSGYATPPAEIKVPLDKITRRR